MRDVVMLFYKKPLFFIFCFLIPFENTTLNSLGGVMTANPTFFLLPALMFFDLFSRKKNNLFCFLFCTIFVFLFSIIGAILFSSEIDLAFTLDRGGRAFVLFTIFLYVLFYCKSEDLNTLLTGSKILLLLSILSLIINVINPVFISESSFIHHNNIESIDRFRGFTPEASTFGFQIVICALLGGVAIKRLKVFFLIAAFVLAVLSTSKGAAITLLISLFIVSLSYQSRIKALLLVSIFSVISYFIFIYYIFPNIYIDVQKFTSIATRSTMIFTSISSLLHYPFGVGFCGYLPVIYEQGPDVIKFISAITPVKLNYSEVSQYFFVGNFESVGTKSFVFDMVIYFGLIFVIPFLLLTWKVYKTFIRFNEYLYAILFIFFIFSLTFYISSFSCYLIPFLFALFFLKYNEIITLWRMHKRIVF